VPDGRVILGAGPVFTYYEFKHPMSDRLTDEKWRTMLISEETQKPDWTIYSECNSLSINTCEKNPNCISRWDICDLVPEGMTFEEACPQGGKVFTCISKSSLPT
jgi:hypothetical protein